MPKYSRKIFCGMESTRLNRNLYKSKAENAEESSNHEFWRKMFCLVAITYTSPKVSVTVNKRVPSKKREGPRGFKFEICFKSTFFLF